MNGAQISVIIPVYNRAHTIARAIHSVLAQVAQPSEIIVVDDGSSDDTLSVVTNIQSDKLKVVSVSENKGVSHARNTGILHSKCEWKAFLDSDDEWAPTKLSQQIEELNRSQLLWVHSNEKWMRNGRPVQQLAKHAKSGGDQFENSLEMCCIGASCVMIHRTLLDECGLFDENLTVCEDYDLWLRISARHSIAFCAEDLTIKHAGHGDQLSFQGFAMDEYRVQSLAKLLAADFLTSKQRQATRDQLFKRAGFLRAAYSRKILDERLKWLEELLRAVDLLSKSSGC